MNISKYPNIPTATRQIATTTLILAICAIGFYFINPDMELKDTTKRFLARAGGFIVLAGGLLGGFGFIWNKDNKNKLFLAQGDFKKITELIRQLVANNQPVPVKLVQELEVAGTAITQAENFETTVAYVGICALIFLTLGTVLQGLSV